MKPMQEIWFKVNTKTIYRKRKLFQKERNDEEQEETRKLILEALDELVKNPKKYARKFETLIPSSTYLCGANRMTAEELIEYLGDSNADWVYQALEWAQRICNGETWEAVCNEKDMTICFRAVVWKNGKIRLVGGSTANDVNYSATHVSLREYDSLAQIDPSEVPLIVRYKKSWQFF